MTDGQDSGGSPPAEKPSDVVLIHGVTDDRRGYKVLRAREGTLEAGAVRPLEHGKPIVGEVVKLKPRENCPLVCDVEVDVPRLETERAARGKGPAKVANDAYRKNWDAIWARRDDDALPN